MTSIFVMTESTFVFDFLTTQTDFQELPQLVCYIGRIIDYLEVMFLMQLCKNIHDGHGPGVLGPEDL